MLDISGERARCQERLQLPGAQAAEGGPADSAERAADAAAEAAAASEPLQALPLLPSAAAAAGPVDAPARAVGAYPWGWDPPAARQQMALRAADCFAGNLS